MFSTLMGAIDGDSVVPLILAAIAAVFLLSGIRRRQRERARNSTPPVSRKFREASRSPDSQSQEQLRRDLEQLLGELQDLSRKIGAEIDTRFAKLEAAMRDADRRIAVLTRLSRAGEAPTPSEASPASEAPSGRSDEDPRYTVVYELADAGFSAVDIARDLGKTPGEIELILNLRRTAQQ
jgi:uncharacterized membrane protein YccC